MYSELDVHIETVCDRLMDYFRDHAISENDPNQLPTIEDLDGDHPTSVITAINHDGRKFKIVIITEEIE